MTLRSGHGNGKGMPRVEVLPADELPDGRPADARGGSPRDRGEAGRFAPGNTIARAGGKARAGKTRLADRMGLRSLPDSAAFAPYKRAAVSFRRAQCTSLAASVGGGYCGPAPSSFVASAALQLAWSRYLADLAAEKGDPELAVTASRLANDSRQNLLAAHELCAKEAKARPADPARFDWLTRPAALPTPAQDASASSDPTTESSPDGPDASSGRAEAAINHTEIDP